VRPEATTLKAAGQAAKLYQGVTFGTSTTERESAEVEAGAAGTAYDAANFVAQYVASA
jgi:hypothetical protein